MDGTSEPGSSQVGHIPALRDEGQLLGKDREDSEGADRV